MRFLQSKLKRIRKSTSFSGRYKVENEASEHVTSAQRGRILADRTRMAMTDFGYGLTGGYPGFGPFAMVPPQWLDAAYMSYAWPEYFRRPTSSDLCKLPIPPCSSLTKGPGTSPLGPSLGFPADIHLGPSIAAFPPPPNASPTAYLGPHGLLGYSPSMEKLLLPHLPKSTESLLANGSPVTVTSSRESSANNQQHGRSPSPRPRTSTMEITSSENSDSDESIDVVKSAFQQVKSNVRSHPYSAKDFRTSRKSPTIKAVSEEKKSSSTSTATILDDSTTSTPATATTTTTTQPQKTVWRPY